MEKLLESELVEWLKKLVGKAFGISVCWLVGKDVWIAVGWLVGEAFRITVGWMVGEASAVGVRVGAVGLRSRTSN